MVRVVNEGTDGALRQRGGGGGDCKGLNGK